MLQFLTYLLYKQIIEMQRSQNLRRPLSVPCTTQCLEIWLPGFLGSTEEATNYSDQKGNGSFTIRGQYSLSKKLKIQ